MDKITNETILSCGHVPTWDVDGIGTGYATWIATGETLCYPCADARQRQVIAGGAMTFHGYVMGTGIYDARLTSEWRTVDGTLSTWTGATLATITHAKRGATRYADRGPWHLTYIRAVTPDGRTWTGALDLDNGQLVTMRARKS